LLNKKSQIKETVRNNPSLLKSIRQGVERECLRVNANSTVAMSDHPKSLGSKLTHPFITTDYSENLLEYITTVYGDEEELLNDLFKMHAFTYKNLENNEVIWPWSMPAIVPEDENKIRVANYGSSNPGRLKELYRVGLGHRYGKSMQSIAGVHYNFSMADDFWEAYKESEGLECSLEEVKNQGYFHLIRNYRRYSSLLVYLFGATPVVHESFLKGKKHNLVKVGKETWGSKFSTSLRMGGLGYTSNAQEDISICYNALSTYIQTLEEARLKSYPEYEKIGLKENNEFKQLNTNLLQIDNEFYSTIRPKNIAKSGQSALGALHERGIEYIEVRLMDVNPFSKTGLNSNTIKFLHSFLLFCLLEDSPKIDKKECNEIDKIFSDIVNLGRDPHLKVVSDGKTTQKEEYFLGIMERIKPYSEMLAKSFENPNYIKIFENEVAKVKDESLLFSSQILRSVSADISIVDVIGALANQYKKEGLEVGVDPNWEKIAKDSLESQRELELEKESFESFHSRYFEEIKINFKGSNA
jgi:glutamate--cysteine ligase